MCNDEAGDAQQRRESAEFLAEKLVDEDSDISKDERQHIVQAMLDAYRSPDKEVGLRLLLAESLAKAPPEYRMRVRREAVATSFEKRENVEIRLAALQILDVIGLGASAVYRNNVEELRDNPKVNARIRKAARQLLGPQRPSRTQSKTK